MLTLNTSLVQSCVFQRSPNWYIETAFLHHPFNTPLPCNRGRYLGKGLGWRACLRQFCWGRHLNCSLPHHPQDSRLPFNSKEKRVHHQDPVEPCAWQPADLRSPSIVCLIDYFPCNYSLCHTQYFTTPGKVQEGLSFLKDSIHIVTFESLIWSLRKHVKLKSSTGHHWRPVLIDCCVMPLWSRDTKNFRADCWGLKPRGSRSRIQFALIVLKLW